MDNKLVDYLIEFAKKKTEYEKANFDDFLPFNIDEYDGYDIGIEDGKIEFAREILGKLNINY
jgi:hypothetical protein